MWLFNKKKDPGFLIPGSCALLVLLFYLNIQRSPDIKAKKAKIKWRKYAARY